MLVPPQVENERVAVVAVCSGTLRVQLQPLVLFDGLELVNAALRE